MTEPKWQRIQRNRDRETDRLPIPGGWLYCVTELHPKIESIQRAFFRERLSVEHPLAAPPDPQHREN